MGAALGLYRALSPVAAALAPLAAPFAPKVRESLAGRRGGLDRLLAAAPGLQGCLWIHASSVGEFLQGIPLVDAVRQELGGGAPPVAFTHFSPSGIAFARRRPCADLHDYLPLDTPRAMDRLVAAWRPRLLVFVKFDVWPNLVVAARRAGVPIFLMAGSLAPGSARLRWPGRALFRDVFDRFTHLGVSTEEDRRRFVDGLRVNAPVSVTGDTRVEQVIVRFEQSRGGAASEALRGLGGRLLVLGSTWPPDEQLWLPVLGDLFARFADLRVVVCPHEPTVARLADLEARTAGLGVAVRRLSAMLDHPDRDARVILVDSIGVLAEIYRAGHLAYVGGSFTTGVHNTMEPAVASLPVLFGPRIQNAEEAGVLVRRGAGFVTARPAAALARAAALLGDPALLRRAGEAARQVVLEQRGAAAKSLAVLRPFCS
ncbi:MAG TPA: glycosyltransferase N-terminal domain-containing protein [Candidatus Krumholzibacteria bacterium]|nr:glycosyltransferase N-terminal domain-containing protein [Candidatus Krumholzibacteria bacterium]HPD71076.1 glycosyltransferase N-terminal domain-containing protein [Candidatus Krumholzibacteria bacterium]HRY39224.1 glycosyltransferase N-terminal domain-containing protein [Candidatus Krumholzibacteria bacterium]